MNFRCLSLTSTIQEVSPVFGFVDYTSLAQMREFVNAKKSVSDLVIFGAQGDYLVGNNNYSLCLNLDQVASIVTPAKLRFDIPRS
jgi:hypothetical protein